MLQVFPNKLFDVNRTFSPGQNDTGPFAIIVGAAGYAITLICIGIDEFEQVPLDTVTV